MTFCHADFNPFFIGGDKTRSGLLPYFQGIQPNIPARSMFIDIIKCFCFFGVMNYDFVLPRCNLHVGTGLPLCK